MIPFDPFWSKRITPERYPVLNGEVPSASTEVLQLTAFDVGVGPLVISQSGGVINARYWMAYHKDGAFYLSGRTGNQWSAPELTVPQPGDVDSLSLAFDQLGRPMFFYHLAGANALGLYWFDPQIDAYTDLDLGQGSEPHLGFDYPQYTSAGFSDVLMFYVRDDQIYFRRQRDRFADEERTYVYEQGVKINRSALTAGYRFQVTYVPETIRDSRYGPKFFQTGLGEIGFSINQIRIEFGMRFGYGRIMPHVMRGKTFTLIEAGSYVDRINAFRLDVVYNDTPQDPPLIVVTTSEEIGSVRLSEHIRPDEHYRFVFTPDGASEAGFRVFQMYRADVLIGQFEYDETIPMQPMDSTYRLRFGAHWDRDVAEFNAYYDWWPSQIRDLYYDVGEVIRYSWPVTDQGVSWDSVPPGVILEFKTPSPTVIFPVRVGVV